MSQFQKNHNGILQKLFSVLFQNISIFRRIYFKKKFKGIYIPQDTRIKVLGLFAYGHNCCIEDGSLISVGTNSELNLGNNCYLGRYSEFSTDTKISIDSYTSIQHRATLVGSISIGRYCLFASGVSIATGRHAFDLKPWLLIKDQDRLPLTKDDPYPDYPVKIEDDCWLGTNVVVLPGVTIGRGSIIGAGAIVTKDVPPYSIVVGNPAKVISTRIEFKPPTMISWDNEKDFPYFYSGCHLHAKERERSKSLQGITVSNKFSLALDSKSSNTIILQIKCANQGGQIRVKNQNKSISLKDGFTNIEFEVSGSEWLHEFEIDSQSAKPNEVSAILQKAWVR